MQKHTYIYLHISATFAVNIVQPNVNAQRCTHTPFLGKNNQHAVESKYNHFFLIASNSYLTCDEQRARLPAIPLFNAPCLHEYF